MNLGMCKRFTKISHIKRIKINTEKDVRLCIDELSF